MTYEERTKRMIGMVESDVDKREGSIIFDAIAPCSWAITDMEFKIDNYDDLVMVDTAKGEYLDRAIGGQVTRKEAVAAIRKITTSSPIPIGSRWSIFNIVYAVNGMIGTNEYSAVCETPGIIGNQYSGKLTPISGSPATAMLEDIIVDGADRESDEALRERYFIKVRYPATSGNAYQYRQWAREVIGVGDAKVFPLDNGPGSVSVYVVDNNRQIDSDLEDPVVDYIESVRPIGVDVSVESPTAKVINVTARLYIVTGASLDTIEDELREELAKYFNDLVRDNYNLPLEDIENNYRVSYAKVVTIATGLEGVNDCDSLSLNDGGNVDIGPKEIPTIGTITLTEAN